ncbi:dihydroorotate dehydrogenase [bacteria symbiont BFo1 of Frankliniella occidentalis]|jgi:magnesium transporter|uniref:Magnesium transporter MgtE n=1 Tax=Erwinia aphidicola TaxID=68334 RepID=A0ABU8DFB8_ERWAP|nr:magnesium transporter [Erwinia aphidicola]KMV71749.1 dihydroorotate dehydrogenase [bacteria symbiont BFo1 of Frankliniella occidentalis]PIJ55407.1 magnesium transporter [Erwinia sp. OLMDLW33]KYP85691.1 dihydroorotate dehydrogenase [bacteria symbiont BFo1 of Frankliniella occidentalis]MBD1375890.1 magnesium transporter [Erwinia aphidicola]CAH0204915.1 Magnesium transporter MgtE [Erwinia aphidicola]
MSVAPSHVQQLAEVRSRILNLLLNDKDLVDTLLERPLRESEAEAEAHREQVEEIKATLPVLHAADIADLLEALPEDERLALWRLIGNDRRGRVLVEASENVWESLIEEMSDRDLLRAIKPLDIDEQVYLAKYLSRDLTGRLLTSLDPELRSRVLDVVDFDRDRVGRIMDFKLVTVRADVTLATVQRFLRSKKTIPDGTDKLFVTGKNNKLLGELPLTEILLNTPEKRVSEVMNAKPTTFLIDDKAEDAAGAFERYNLISAAVIDAKGKLMGRVTIEDVVDLVNETNDSSMRKMGGVNPEEDVFAPVRKAVRTRWAWLAVNLCTAFVASRVIGLFEATISQLVALAALMPIVAGIGGNTGNQTITMIVRALALHQVEPGNFSFLIGRELGVALINGLFWGGIMGGITWAMYGNPALGGVMMLAMVLNLLLAALMGVLIPLLMTKFKRDPAVGSSVLITALTDTGGFFIFLGLATIFLLP